MRLLICGDRNWTDKEKIKSVIKVMLDRHGSITVIQGEARGADRLAKEAALELGCEVLSFPANWTKHGQAAGPIRNQQMLEEGKPEYVIAFHENIHQSKGTKDMVTRSRKAGLTAIVIGEEATSMIRQQWPVLKD